MSSPRTISSLLHRSRRTCIHAITNHPTWMREGQAEPESPAPSNGRVAYRGSPCPTDRMGSPRARASRPAMLPKVRDSRVGPSGFGTGEKVEGNRRHSLVGCSVPRSIRPASRTATGPSRYCVPRAGGSRSPRCSSPMAPTGVRPCGWHRPLATKSSSWHPWALPDTGEVLLRSPKSVRRGNGLGFVPLPLGRGEDVRVARALPQARRRRREPGRERDCLPLPRQDSSQAAATRKGRSRPADLLGGLSANAHAQR